MLNSSCTKTTQMHTMMLLRYHVPNGCSSMSWVKLSRLNDLGIIVEVTTLPSGLSDAETR